MAGCHALCFLTSGDVQSPCGLDVESRGHVSIATLTEGGRFANQLFRYAAVKLYAFPQACRAAIPEWEGRQLFGLDDRSSKGLVFHRLTYAGFSEEDRKLWELDDPPIDIDLAGYFQELPECWRKHRPLLRRLFQLPPEQRGAIDAWRDDVTRGGRRTLVAIHVRRGDYKTLQLKDTPWFRIVPEEWYLQWLRNIWPTLREPLLFVATDDPDAILPVFQEFEMVRGPSGSMAGSMAPALPEHVLDFEILRRADRLAICNSSYSRMAAILAPDSQQCVLPSFGTQAFEPYDPWTDSAFWARFADAWSRTHLRGARHEGPVEPAAIFIDLSDLLHHLFHHTTLSGIQRVQCEILRNLLEIAHTPPVRFVVFRKQGGMATIDASALLHVIDDLRFGTTPRAEIESGLVALLDGAVPCTVSSQEVFLTLGAFWNMKGIGGRLQELKNSGVLIGVFIHDILPIVAPEYFDTRETVVFVKGVSELLTFADFIFTTSSYNQECLAAHLASRNLGPLPIHLVPLSHEFPAPIESNISSAVAGVIETDFVLAVGTIEARKNPGYLFNIWKMLVRSGRPNVPCLVFAGRKGWLVQDVLDQMKACNYLGGKILLLHNVTDCELDLLYRNCMLTMFPSFIEGWGLPVGESLAHGKICLCSGTGGIRQAGGELGDYIDPYNAHDGYQQLVRYLDDPELRDRREREIAERFEPRRWRTVTDDLLSSTRALASQVKPFEGVAAVELPPDRYLPIGSEAVTIGTDGVDARLSTELICVSGWRPPEAAGVRAAQPSAMIRFRTDAAAGTGINLALRLAAYGRDFRLRIRAGSGAETEVSLSRGAERLAVLSCAVEPGQLVTAQLSLSGEASGEAIDAARRDQSPGAPCWILKGILYFDPKRVAGDVLSPSGVSCEPAAPAAGSGLLLRSCAMGERRRAASLTAFLQAANSYWTSSDTADRAAPIFADEADRQTFDSGCGKAADAPQVGRVQDSVRLIRRTDQFVAMSRFSEGSVFDRVGVWRALGYLQHPPAGTAPWLSKEGDGIRISEDVLATAPVYNESCLIFYNGNLHNYYHWLVEGLLCLDILSRTLEPTLNLKILLPKSMDVHAVLDHRETLRALGFGGHASEEVASPIVRVREAIWVDSDLVQYMPAPYLKNFQQRIAARYAGQRGPRKRRLLVARRGVHRSIRNIGQVQDLLSRYSFETVYLEGMSMADQILLFQSAEFIIGPHGAGLANLLFCEPGTKVIEFMPMVEFRPFFWVISEKLGLVHGLQFCDPAAGQGFQDAIHVDTGKLETLMRRMETHLVSRRPVT